MLRLSRPLDPNTQASVMFLSDGGPVLAKAEMLSPLSRTQQAFRFMALDRNCQLNLQRGIQSHLKQSADEADGLRSIEPRLIIGRGPEEEQ